MFTLDYDIDLSILRGKIEKCTMVRTVNDRCLEKQDTKVSDAV
jgi:hypothetical protein